MGCLQLTYRTENSLLQVAWNSLQEGEKSCTGNYRFGFNSQESDPEISGSWGTHYTAEYWMYDARVNRRWNVDPVVNPSQSGYSVLANNPILMVDPSGDAEYTFDEEGKLIGDVKPNPEQDIFHVETPDGRQTKTFDKIIVTEFKQDKHRGKDVSVFDITNEDDARDLFQYFGGHTKVEWGHTVAGQDGKNNYLSTSHEKEREQGVGYVFQNYLIPMNLPVIRFDHNHPSGNRFPSGMTFGKTKDGELLDPGTWGDVKAVEFVDRHNIRVKSDIKPVFHIYTTKGGFSPYDRNTVVASPSQ